MRKSRVAAVLALIVLSAAVLVSPALAGSPNKGHNKFRDGVHPSCHGLANAYAHGGNVAAVAAAHGCDLTGITPIEHPTGGQPDTEPDGEGGPPAEVVAAKCDRIAAKLEIASAREHGNSAAAFARQADKWSCPG